MNRYDISYDPHKNKELIEDLRRLGIEVAFNNSSAGRLIASIPSERLEKVKGLTGILDITESPLPGE
jgi:hypothetical protein